MRSIVSMTLAACAVAALSSSALAQTPAPATPPAQPSSGGTPDAIAFVNREGDIAEERSRTERFANRLRVEQESHRVLLLARRGGCRKILLIWARVSGIPNK